MSFITAAFADVASAILAVVIVPHAVVDVDGQAVLAVVVVRVSWNNKQA